MVSFLIPDLKISLVLNLNHFDLLNFVVLGPYSTYRYNLYGKQFVLIYYHVDPYACSTGSHIKGSGQSFLAPFGTLFYMPASHIGR